MCTLKSHSLAVKLVCLERQEIASVHSCHEPSHHCRAAIMDAVAPRAPGWLASVLQPTQDLALDAQVQSCCQSTG